MIIISSDVKAATVAFFSLPLRERALSLVKSAEFTRSSCGTQRKKYQRNPRFLVMASCDFCTALWLANNANSEMSASVSSVPMPLFVLYKWPENIHNSVFDAKPQLRSGSLTSPALKRLWSRKWTGSFVLSLLKTYKKDQKTHHECRSFSGNHGFSISIC